MANATTSETALRSGTKLHQPNQQLLFTQEVRLGQNLAKHIQILLQPDLLIYSAKYVN